MDERIQKVKDVFAVFDAQNVGYCVLRNYEFLLGENYPFESIDMTVAQRDMEVVAKRLVSLGFTERLPQFSLKHRAFFCLIGLKIVSFDIQVGGVYWNDMRYLGEEILDHRVKKGFFYVPNDDDTFVMLTAHSILGKRYFKEKYQRILGTLYNSVDQKYVFEKLSAVFGCKNARVVLEHIRMGNFKQVKVYYLVFYFIFKRFEHVKIFSLLFLRWLRWKKILQPWPLISVIGPDGAGKSTAVNSLLSFLQENNFSSNLIYTGRGRSHFLPITKLGKIYKQAEKRKDKKVIVEIQTTNFNNLLNYKQKKQDTFLRRLIYTLAAPLFTLDLLFRYYFRIFPQRIMRKVVITDRYCSDILLMKNVPLKFKFCLLRLFPKPTITFYLYNTPDVLHERRPQEPLEELKRQLLLFKELKLILKPVDIITQNKELNDQLIIATVADLLFKKWY